MTPTRMREMRLVAHVLWDRSRRSLGSLLLTALAAVMTIYDIQIEWIPANYSRTIWLVLAALAPTLITQGTEPRAVWTLPMSRAGRALSRWFWNVHVAPLVLLLAALACGCASFILTGKWGPAEMDISLVVWVIYAISAGLTIAIQNERYATPKPARSDWRLALSCVLALAVLGALIYRMPFTWAEVEIRHRFAQAGGVGLLAISWVYRGSLSPSAAPPPARPVSAYEPWTPLRFTGAVGVPFMKDLQVAFNTGLKANVFLAAAILAMKLLISPARAPMEEHDLSSADFPYYMAAVCCIVGVSGFLGKKLLPPKIYRTLPITSCSILTRWMLLHCMVYFATVVVFLPLVTHIDIRNLWLFPLILGNIALANCLAEILSMRSKNRGAGLVILVTSFSLSTLLLLRLIVLTVWPHEHFLSASVALGVFMVLLCLTSWFYHHTITHNMNAVKS